MWDGYCYGGAQMMRAPYLNVYGCITHGQRHISAEKSRVCDALRSRAQTLRLNILSMGTQSHDEILDMVERVAGEYDVPPLNWVLVHSPGRVKTRRRAIVIEEIIRPRFF
jgi:hypothetical protein